MVGMTMRAVNRFCGGRIVAAAFALAALATPALAQGVTVLSTSTTEVLLFNPATITTTQLNAFSTQVLGRLNGGTVFNQTFAAAVNDASVQAGFASARLAITASGGPGVVIGTPQRLSSTTTTATTSSSIYSLAGQTSVTDSVLTFGTVAGTTIITGARSTCNVSGLPSATQPTCINGGTPLVAGIFDTNLNLNTTTTSTIDTATTNTTTTTLSEVWAIDGTVRQMGTGHSAVQPVAFDIGDIFLARMLAPGQANLGTPLMDGGKPTRWTAFLEAFGLTRRQHARQKDIADVERDRLHRGVPGAHLAHRTVNRPDFGESRRGRVGGRGVDGLGDVGVDVDVRVVQSEHQRRSAVDAGWPRRRGQRRGVARREGPDEERRRAERDDAGILDTRLSGEGIDRRRGGGRRRRRRQAPVSYTHLTLPTIYSV